MPDAWWTWRADARPARARWFWFFWRSLHIAIAPVQALDVKVPVLGDSPATIHLGDKPCADGDLVPGLAADDAASPGHHPDPDRAPRSRLEHVLFASLRTRLGSPGPLAWPSSLFGFQATGIEALLQHPALLLADDMGLGKTVQAIAAMRMLVLCGRVDSALVVVRAGLVTQWRRELQRWAPELRVAMIRGPASDRVWQWTIPAHVYVVGYETLRSDFTENPQSPPRRRVWDLVILDEAQAIKNRNAEVSGKCKRLERQRAWALTGTPLENAEDDLASVMEFVTPHAEGATPLRLGPGSALRARHQSLQLRRKKGDVLTQLPPKMTTRVALTLEGEQRVSYDRAEREGIMRLRAQGQSVRIESVLELIIRLKQICNFCPATGRSAKLDDMGARLHTLVEEGHRALVFSQFTDDRHGVRAIAAALGDLNPLAYTGDLNSAERDRVLAAFKADDSHKMLVVSLRAGGQGLNLQEASYVFHFDRWWNPAVEHQAEDRSHRLGQTMPVHVYTYTCEGTIEERIERILQEKQALFNLLVDDVSIDLRSAFSAEELFGLFGLERSSRAAR
jgi:SNF2 family DNA or RNA helicase